jgi:hypothetical protein
VRSQRASHLRRSARRACHRRGQLGSGPKRFLDLRRAGGCQGAHRMPNEALWLGTTRQSCHHEQGHSVWRTGRLTAKKKLVAQVGENSQDTPVIGIGLDKPEFAKDVLDVLLDRAFRHVECFGDGVVGATFSHKSENLPFARG